MKKDWRDLFYFSKSERRALTLLSFLGQIFTGIAIDLALGQNISGGLFWGGVICAAGFLASMLIEMHNKKVKP